MVGGKIFKSQNYFGTNYCIMFDFLCDLCDLNEAKPNLT